MISDNVAILSRSCHCWYSSFWHLHGEVGLATNFNISSRQGFKFYGLLGAFRGLLMTIPCQSLPDPCLNFTINASMQFDKNLKQNDFIPELRLVWICYWMDRICSEPEPHTVNHLQSFISFHHPVIPSSYHPFILSSSHPANRPFGHPVTLSSCHYCYIIMSSYHHAILSSCYPVIVENFTLGYDAKK